jgi:hypothetical protein
MCIFSGTVSSVGNTRIFARGSAHGRQFLVYSMEYQAGAELAMILPLPTPPSPAEDAVRFIDLSGYPRFFDDMARAFVRPEATLGFARGLDVSALRVHDVGSFHASFVPRLDDFARLDRRFRLPDQAWEQLPQYREYAFAVFELQAGARTIHPMAFEFPRRNAAELFFPTVHVHHGAVEPRAEFDHSLYCQTSRNLAAWRTSASDVFGAHATPAVRFVKVDRARGIVDPKSAVQFQRLLGIRSNEDTIIRETS